MVGEDRVSIQETPNRTQKLSVFARKQNKNRIPPIPHGLEKSRESRGKEQVGGGTMADCYIRGERMNWDPLGGDVQNSKGGM